MGWDPGHNERANEETRLEVSFTVLSSRPAQTWDAWLHTPVTMTSACSLPSTINSYKLLLGEFLVVVYLVTVTRKKHQYSRWETWYFRQ